MKYNHDTDPSSFSLEEENNESNEIKAWLRQPMCVGKRTTIHFRF